MLSQNLTYILVIDTRMTCDAIQVEIIHVNFNIIECNFIKQRLVQVHTQQYI